MMVGMGRGRATLGRLARWTGLVIVPMLLVALAAEGAMRVAERRLANYDYDLDRGDEPVIKLKAASALLADGGVLYTGASDAESAFVPAIVAREASEAVPGYDGAVGGLPLDTFGPWIDDIRDAGGDPDVVVVGLSPVQFLDLPLDTDRGDGGTIELALQGIRDNIARAPQYAGRPGGIGDHLALVRSRHRLLHPSDAWNALRGGPPPAPSNADLDLRPDGTNRRWDTAMTPEETPAVQATPEVIGEVEPDLVDELDDVMTGLEAADVVAGVVLFPLTPELEPLRGSATIDEARRVATEALCTDGIGVLDLSDAAFTPEMFANLEHFSPAGAEWISSRVGSWLADGSIGSCP
jgi:hypothetical protein